LLTTFTVRDPGELVVLTRAEYDALTEDNGDAALIRHGRSGPTMPAELALHVAEGSMHPLAAWRKVAGLSQTALAKRSGQRIATISDIENGRTDPRLSTLKAIAGALGVEAGDLVD
jgi:DNA-binding XRE family transcriptional regulator